MVERQLGPHTSIAPKWREVFFKISRESFGHDFPLSVIYSDGIISLSNGRPILPISFLAKMLHHMNPTAAHTAMVVAGGSGYTAAVLGQFCATVFLCEEESTFLKSLHGIYEEMNASNIIPMQCTLREGLPGQGPFDFIIFDVGVTEVPTSFFTQLKDQGILIACMIKGTRFGEVTSFFKEGVTLRKKVLFEFFIPPILSLSNKDDFCF